MEGISGFTFIYFHFMSVYYGLTVVYSLSDLLLCFSHNVLI
jgi:hypothetical protein